MSPRLTVCSMVSNAEDRFDHWAERALEFADELVVCVDSASADGTLERARSVADTVATFEHTDVNFHVMDWAAHLATGDWILWLDDDELLHRDFAEHVRPLLGDRSVTHYWQPCRWLVEDGGTLSWIRQFPWYPNPMLRLFRNLGGVFSHAGRPHSPFDLLGDGRLLTGDELALWHTVFLIRDQDALRAKVARYGSGGISCGEYYLLDEAGPLALEPAPAGAVIRDAAPEARAEARRRRRRLPGREDAIPFADAATLGRFYGRHRPEAEIYAAEYVSHDTPATIAANQGTSVRVTVRNTSRYPWRAHGQRRGRVALSYHWEHDRAGTLVRQGDVSALPHNLGPGEAVTVDAGIWGPYQPGSYQLVWDLQTEDVSWFSDRGVAPLRIPVQVSGQGRRLARPRPAAELPAHTAPGPGPGPKRVVQGVLRWSGAFVDAARSQAELRAANLRPISPERLFDSRNGTGVPGARPGPLEAGDEVRLAVAGHRGIPDTAMGVALSVSVIDADYNGYLTLRPAGTRATTVVAHYSKGAGPTTSSVVVGLGSGNDRGALSLVPSDNWPGRVQVMIDATAYLEGPRPP